MKSGYDQYFKQKAKSGKKSASQPKVSRHNLPVRKKRKKDFPVFPIIGAAFGLVIGLWSMFNVEKVEEVLDAIEISAFTLSEAQTKPAAKSDETKETKSEDLAEAEKEAKASVASSRNSWTPEEVALFKKLDERKRQLDMREQELNKLDEELQRQKVMLETRMQELEKTRRKIAGQLEERVQVDEKRVNKLVDVYSNMKPANAAKVFEKLDEDLAVEVLGNMKKKSAADILNLLPAEKAQKLSEKYTGYTRR